eukprot:5894643-Pyramimonas_sp.AAC.1
MVPRAQQDWPGRVAADVSVGPPARRCVRLSGGSRWEAFVGRTSGRDAPDSAADEAGWGQAG